MKLTDEILLKYVDGHLSTIECEAVEKLLGGDEIAREKLRLMKVSGVALSNIEITENEQLRAEILLEKLQRQNTPEIEQGSAHRGADPFDTSVSKAANPSQLYWNFGKIAAALVVVLGGVFAGYWVGVGSLPAEEVHMASLPTWVARVVDYHTLYDRETVASSETSVEETEVLEQQFGTLLDQKITIPNLESVALQFKRGQILKFEGEEIIQLAYLPNTIGKPVALCLRLSQGVDTQPDYSVLRGLGVARWRQDGIEYLLLGERAQGALMEATQLAYRLIEQG